MKIIQAVKQPQQPPRPTFEQMDAGTLIKSDRTSVLYLVIKKTFGISEVTCEPSAYQLSFGRCFLVVDLELNRILWLTEQCLGHMQLVTGEVVIDGD